MMKKDVEKNPESANESWDAMISMVILGVWMFTNTSSFIFAYFAINYCAHFPIIIIVITIITVIVGVVIIVIVGCISVVVVVVMYVSY